MKPLDIFDKLASYLKRLTLDYDLSPEEAGDLSHVNDELNVVREQYVDRKLEQCETPSSSE